MSGLDQARTTARFVSKDPVDATFTAATTMPVMLRDVSVIGAQIEHAHPVRPAMQGRLSIGDLEAPATVVWTRLTGPGQYRSGLRIEAPLEVVAAAIRDLLARGVVRKGEDTIRQREEAKIERQKSRMRLTGLESTAASLTVNDIRNIRDARKWMQSHPEDAIKWYYRARATATEDHLRIAGSGRTNREDVLAVWEYLERGFDLRDVVRALE
jgi:uncharacterized protein YbjT (DUF2867 family)